MCENCVAYGDGGIWYKNHKNYAKEMYTRRQKNYAPTAAGEDWEGRLIKMRMDTVTAKSRAPDTFPELRDQTNEYLRKYRPCQVLPLQDILEIMDISSPLVKMSCMCRKSVRALEENSTTFSCMGTGVGMFKWDRWPERYKGGVEFVTSQQAKDWLSYWNNRGMVHIIMTFGAPNYIAGICNCDYPDCLMIRYRLDYGLKYALLKGEYVAKLDYEKCTGCGICIQRCQFGAIKKEVTTNKANFDMFKCFGCGLCETGCSQSAVTLIPRKTIPALREDW